MRFSICIAAYNEEAAIGNLLAALAGRPADIDEVLVCANGCTDATASLARAHCRVIETPLGKNLAWNTLVREARHDALIFVDADVVPDWAVVERLCAALRLGESAAVSAVATPVIAGAPLSTAAARLLCVPRNPDFLCGRLYVCERRRLADVFSRQGLPTRDGLPELPLDVLLEDLFLTFALAPHALHVQQDALISYDPGSIDDLCRVTARHRAALDQVVEHYPAQLRHVHRQRPLSKLRALIATLTHAGSFASKGDALVRAAVRGAFPLVFHRQIARHYAVIQRDLARGHGGTILATSGRVGKPLR